ncbi:MAG: malate/lactate/ureidoglycolate dehydrogenase [Afipia sp.]|nr:malate/lactate/ureidoglycolate dehydrogenase [Afipia sp.]
MITINSQKLIGFVADIFARAGSSKAEAERIATYLTTANLTGHDSHGVIRVPKYVGWVQDGSIVPDQKIKVEVDTPSLAVIDGGFGYGQTVTPQAVRIGIDKCKANGVAVMTLKNSGHLGRVGDWAEMAAAERLISIHFVNAAGSVLVAPFGGVARKLSTAPYCVGIPRPGQGPVVLDFATSLVAEGKVMVASRGGKILPKGALISEDGNLNEDPHELYGPYDPTGPRNHALGTGAIRAFGEHKGSGLALICELLGGALTGNGATKTDRRFANGMLAIYIDPKVVDPAHFFDGEVARYIAYFKDSKLAQGHDAVLIPGEPEAAMRAERGKNGIPLTEETWGSIVATGRALGIDEAAIKAAEG